MLVGVAIGQRTPGHSTAEAAAFEARINQRYVDFIDEAGWGYTGLYDVGGLVAGACAEILLVDAPDVATALEWDARHEEGGVPEDVGAFYAECRALFWSRGSLRFWLSLPDGAALPVPGVALAVTLLADVEAGSWVALPWSGMGDPPVGAARLEILGPDQVDLDDVPLPGNVAELPTTPPLPLRLLFRPLATAPFPSRVSAQRSSPAP